MKKQQVAALATAALTALTVTACGSSSGSSAAPKTAASAAAPVDINIGAVGNMSTVALYAAIENGTFLKYGIKAKLQIFANGAAVSKALQSGTVQATSSANTTVTTTVASGTNVVY